MGLDMYLTAKKFMWLSDDGAHAALKDNPLVADLLEAGVPYQEKPYFSSGFKIDYIIVQAAYWRKANAIHRWFVEHIQDGTDDCGTYEVTRESLIELKERCQEVLLLPKLAEELLPPQEGFFFGGTAVDDWYFNDLRNTVKQIEFTEKYPKEWYFEYGSSW